MKSLVTVMVVVLGLGVVARVEAHDHRPPRATMRVAGEVQKGLLYHADAWARQSEEAGFCEADFSTGFPIFPRAVRHLPGQEIIVRFHKPAPPVEVEVRRWPRVNDKGHAAGTPRPLPFLLRPRVVQGSVRAWEVVVLPPVVDGHLYLGVDAYWRDEDGCYQEPDLGSQFAAWTFHLRAR